MTINEFRAWLDGFKEAIGEAPTPDQWAKVLEKVATVNEPHVFPNVQPNIIGPWVSPSWPYTPRFGEITCQNGTQAVVNGRPVGPSD